MLNEWIFLTNNLEPTQILYTGMPELDADQAITPHLHQCQGLNSRSYKVVIPQLMIIKELTKTSRHHRTSTQQPINPWP
jgi:hypothetical protein